MPAVGYEFLRDSLRIPTAPLQPPAFVKAVSRVVQEDDHLAVPAHVAPTSDSPLAHLLFALKHEGVDLGVISHAVHHVADSEIAYTLMQSPTGRYIRPLGYLWEAFRQQEIDGLVAAGGPTVDLFDRSRYVVGPAVRNSRWRVNWNGLGTLAYCATVRRTRSIEQGLGADILGRTNEFAAKIGPEVLDRSLSWAYLSETESSFAIEREAPSADKARAFVALLRQAHERRPLTEDYLVELQNSVIANPLDKASQFRVEQNWLKSGGLRGAAGVSYVPPPPELAAELMESLMALGNWLPSEVDPIVAAAIVSFGFVFIHPFMDGNGRLSRFLFHHAMCRSGKLAEGLLLPVSIAMKRHEARYLAALKAFSRPAREFWSVRAIDESHYLFDFKGSPSLYRYWDATQCVEFGMAVAEEALRQDLQGESQFLLEFDKVQRAIDGRFDLRGSDLVTLILGCFDNEGAVSKHRRKQYADRVPATVFDAIEAEVRAVLATRRVA